MLNLKEMIIGAVAVFALVIAVVGGNNDQPQIFSGSTKSSFDAAQGFLVNGTSVISSSRGVSATTGTFSSSVNVGEFTQGGGETTLTDANGGTYTLTEAEMLAAGTFRFAAGGAGQAVIALTFPATSTMTTLIPNAGDCRTWWYDASALAAATTTTMTAGTGHNIIAYTTNDDVIDGNEFAQITMCRATDTDVNTFVSELVHAD